jgi:hypothetical protein
MGLQKKTIAECSRLDEAASVGMLRSSTHKVSAAVRHPDRADISRKFPLAHEVFGNLDQYGLGLQ